MTDMDDHEKILSDEERVAVVDALRAIRNKVRWKPGKDIIQPHKTSDSCLEMKRLSRREGM